ncbi:hypothetical protein V6N13_083602 [Hibiscus sabdariffa]|uniref:Uncharacterized protein n=1 Tax=Hibiscus sabdariffa TaxID=183260 RepID=A0ABR2SYJ7_9ROSI
MDKIKAHKYRQTNKEQKHSKAQGYQSKQRPEQNCRRSGHRYSRIGWYEATDKLAAMGRGHSKEGRLLLVPPGMVTAIVNDKQRRWLRFDDPAGCS